MSLPVLACCCRSTGTSPFPPDPRHKQPDLILLIPGQPRQAQGGVNRGLHCQLRACQGPGLMLPFWEH